MSFNPEITDFIDIHSHHQYKAGNEFRIVNHILFHESNPPEIFPLSRGIHPWYIPSETTCESAFATLMSECQKDNIIAIGECGLDKTIEHPFDWQVEIFKAHVQASNILNKPLIIHCVKAGEVLIRLRKEDAGNQNWIYHGFTGSPEMAMEMCSNNIMISIGERMVRNEEKLNRILKSVPLSSIFMETDESQMSIKEIYRIVSGLKGEPVDKLKSIMYDNFKRVFSGNI